MAQAISTKYLGPTNNRGARVVAKSASGHRHVMSWDHALNVPDNHAAAAQELAEKLAWVGKWHGGATADGYVFVSEGLQPTFHLIGVAP